MRLRLRNKYCNKFALGLGVKGDTMKRILVVTIILLLFGNICFANEISLFSPNGKLELKVDTNANCFSLSMNGASLLEDSSFGVNLFGESLPSSQQLEDWEEGAFFDEYQMIHGKASSLKYEGKKLTVYYGASPKKGVKFSAEFNLSNDGLAFRYILVSPKTIKLKSEKTTFQFGKGARCWAQEMSFMPSYERIYKVRDIDSIKNAPYGFAFPVLVESGENYLLLSESGQNDSYCLTRLNKVKGKSAFSVGYPHGAETTFSGSRLPKANGQMVTTWKTIAAGSLADIVASDLVTHVAEPEAEIFKSVGKEWIVPGISAWDWLNNNFTDGPDVQKKYIAAASEYGWKYVLIDANWNKWNGGDFEPVIRDLVNYADSLGVKIWLWYNSGGPHNAVGEQPRNLMHKSESRKATFAWLQKMGIVGIKVDFFRSDYQERVSQYADILEDAAEAKIMINFHGCTAPRGLRRTYPNLVSMEAVRGGEYYRKGEDDLKAMESMLYCYTRNVVGAIDYTPFFVDPRFLLNGMDYMTALAQMVLFESAAQHACGSVEFEGEGYPEFFKDCPEAKELLRTMPTAWDLTRLVEGTPDTHCVLFREKGDKKYIVGVVAEESTKVNIANIIAKELPGVACQVFYSDADPMKINVVDVAAGELLDASVEVGNGQAFIIAY